MSDLETLIRNIVRDELETVAVGNPETRAGRRGRARGVTKPTSNAFESLTPGQKAARTRKLRAAGYKAWATRRRNEAAASLGSR